MAEQDPIKKEQLANEISEILKDNNLPAKERLEKMKKHLDANKTEAANVPPQPKISDQYNNAEFRKAAIRNQILNKNKNN